MSKPGQYTRVDLVETALRILDEFGLADLSMRRLASVLEVQPSALYWHVPNKQTLLAHVADEIIDRAAVVDREALGDWESITLAEAGALRDALLAYRDGAEVVSSTLALGLGAGAALERIESALALGFAGQDANQDGSPADMVHVAAESILFLVLGQVWHEQQRLQADSLGVVAPAVASVPSDATASNARVLHGQSSSLEFGVALILEGLEKKLALNHGSR